MSQECCCLGAVSWESVSVSAVCVGGCVCVRVCLGVVVWDLGIPLISVPAAAAEGSQADFVDTTKGRYENLLPPPLVFRRLFSPAWSSQTTHAETFQMISLCIKSKNVLCTNLRESLDNDGHDSCIRLNRSCHTAPESAVGKRRRSGCTAAD